MFFSKVYICSLLFYYYILVFNSDLQILIWPFQNVLDKNSFRFFFIYLFFFTILFSQQPLLPCKKKKEVKKVKYTKTVNLILQETFL